MKVRRILILTVILAALSGLLFAPAALAHGSYATEAACLDAEILGPRGSVITGAMIEANVREFGIPARTQLVILGAETSLGTRSTGGRLVDLNNFGCIRAFGGYASTPWGALANGTVTIRGKAWLTWPSREIGMRAWGLYMVHGVGGRYIPLVFGVDPDWRAFARIYYGASVPGLEDYIANLGRIDAAFTAKARAHGFDWTRAAEPEPEPLDTELAAALAYVQTAGLFIGDDGDFRLWEPLTRRHLALVAGRAGYPTPEGWLEDYREATRGEVAAAIPTLRWTEERWGEPLLRSQAMRLFWRVRPWVVR